MCGKMGGTWRSRRAGAVAVGTVVPVVARTSGGVGQHALHRCSSETGALVVVSQPGIGNKGMAVCGQPPSLIPIHRAYNRVGHRLYHTAPNPTSYRLSPWSRWAKAS